MRVTTAFNKLLRLPGASVTGVAFGGEAEEPRPVAGMGWFAICRDSEGNDFGLWQSDASAPAPSE